MRILGTPTLEADRATRVRFGPFEADFRAGELLRSGQRVPLQPLPFELLGLLVERCGEIVTREELRERLWPEGTFVDFEHGLNTAVRKLRRVLDDGPDRSCCIETIPKRGYRFVASFERVELPQPTDGAEVAAGRPPFVGRAAELGRLRARLADARVGRGGLVLVHGEPGVGKTRLLEELAVRARRGGTLVLAGRCVPREGGPPYAPFAEALDAWARTAAEAMLRDVTDAGTAGVVARIAPRLRARWPDLPSPRALRPDEERHRLLDAVARLLLGLATQVPTILLLDDLQWGNAGTLEMLRHVARRAGGARLLLVGSCRDGEGDRSHPLREALVADPGCEPVALAGLGPTRVRELIDVVTPGGASSELGHAVHRVTAGNPLFLRELLLHWLREGRSSPGAGPRAALGLPESLGTMLEWRLARVSPEAQQLLATASTFAGSFEFGAIAQAEGLEEGAALDALDEALEAQLVRPAGRTDDYDFAHALIRHALYDAIEPARRVRLHRRLAAVLSRGEALAGERAAQIAEHFHSSRDLPGAEAGVAACLAASGYAEAASDYAGVARYLRMALDLLPGEDARRPRLLARRGLALAWSGAALEAAAVAEEAGEAIAGSEGDDAAADYLAEAADSVWRRGYSPLAWPLAQQGLRHAGARRDWTWARLAGHDLLAREARDPELPGLPRDTPQRREVFAAVLANSHRIGPHEQTDIWRSVIFDSREHALAAARHQPACLAFYVGDYAGAIAILRQAAEATLDHGQLAGATQLLSNLAILEASAGRLDLAEERLAQAYDRLSRVEEIPSVALVLHATATQCAGMRGIGIESPLQRLVETMGRADSLQMVIASLRVTAARWQAHLGFRDEALRSAASTRLAVERLPGWAPNYAILVHQYAAVLWTLECTGFASRLESNLREKTLRPDFRFPCSDARLSLARLCALTHRYEEARGWFARARLVLDEQGAAPLRAIADFDEARMYVRRGTRGDRERSLPLLDAAAARFEAIGMPGWLEQADALRAELGS